MARMGRPPKPARERFMRQTRITASGCIEWTGYLDPDGYGKFRPGGRDTNHVGAHRWAYAHFVGPIPPGLHLDHLCRNRACVNPAHLEPVTPRENWRRGNGPARINADKTHCIRGHELAGENLGLSRNGSIRYCRTCKKAASAAAYQKKKAS